MLIKRGKVWYYQTKINGKTWKRSTGHSDKRLAEREARKFEAQVRLRKNRPGDWLKFSQAAHRETQRLEADVSFRCAKRALESFTEFLKWAGRDVELTEIDTPLLEEFQRHRLRRVCLKCGELPKISETTCVKCQGAVGSRVALSTITKDLDSIIRLLDQNDIALKKPSLKPGRRRETRAFTYDELIRFFNHCSESFRPLYATLLCTGARLAELAPSSRSTHTPLLKTELDFENGLIRLRQAKARPGSKAKLRPPIPIPADLVELLRWQITQTPDDYPFVFTRQHNPTREFQAALRRVGIPVTDAAGRHLWIHSFRHTYCTLLSELISNAWQLKEILGHAKLSTTERYTHVDAKVIPLLAVSLLPTRGSTDKPANKPARIEPSQLIGGNRSSLSDASSAGPDS